MPQGYENRIFAARTGRISFSSTSPGLAITLLLASTTVVHAQSNAVQNEVVLSELSVTGTGPAVERADSPVGGYRATRSATATKTDTPARDPPQSINIRD